MRRRQGLKLRKMRRLRVLVSQEAYEQLRSFAPEYGSGAIVEHMIELEAARRAKVSPYGKNGVTSDPACGNVVQEP